ncbi:MAG: helix-turn-helix transcriptional regulator [Peptococcaceae bacterium]|nr:helix-turn-helix transcriptional regulator [Peptococcaceae bacterium]
MTIGEIIRTKRKALSLTQEQIASHLGVSASAVYKWEKGASYPEITLLAPLARLLKIDINALMSFQDEPNEAEITKFIVNGYLEASRLKDFSDVYDDFFNKSMDKIREFPNCEMLIFAVLYICDIGDYLTGSDKQTHYQETFDKLYQQLSTSKKEWIKAFGLEGVTGEDQHWEAVLERTENEKALTEYRVMMLACNAAAGNLKSLTDNDKDSLIAGLFTWGVLSNLARINGLTKEELKQGFLKKS